MLALLKAQSKKERPRKRNTICGFPIQKLDSKKAFKSHKKEQVAREIKAEYGGSYYRKMLASIPEPLWIIMDKFY